MLNAFKLHPLVVLVFCKSTLQVTVRSKGREQFYFDLFCISVLGKIWFWKEILF